MIIWDSESGNASIYDDRCNFKLDERGNYAFIVANYPYTSAHYATVLFHGPDAKEISEKWNSYVLSNSIEYIHETEKELKKFMENSDMMCSCDIMEKKEALNDFRNKELIKNNRMLNSMMEMDYQDAIDFLNGWLSGVDVEEGESKVDKAIASFLKGIGELKDLD